MKKTFIDNELICIRLQGKIMICVWKVDLTDIYLVKSIVDLRLKITAEMEPYPIIVDIRQVKNTSKEVRDFLAGPKAAERVTVAALLTESMLTTTIGNFFLRVNKPPVPIKLFTNEEEAIKWLNQKHKV